jgi:hypothetical protein
MNHLSSISKNLILIYLFVYVGVCMAEDANNPNFISEISHLELANAVHPNSDDIAFKQGSSESNFLLSHEITRNKVIGMNYGTQEIESDLVSDDKSKLWLTLQLAF